MRHQKQCVFHKYCNDLNILKHNISLLYSETKKTKSFMPVIEHIGRIKRTFVFFLPKIRLILNGPYSFTTAFNFLISYVSNTIITLILLFVYFVGNCIWLVLLYKKKKNTFLVSTFTLMQNLVWSYITWVGDMTERRLNVRRTKKLSTPGSHRSKVHYYCLIQSSLLLQHRKISALVKRGGLTNKYKLSTHISFTSYMFQKWLNQTFDGYGPQHPPSI